MKVRSPRGVPPGVALAAALTLAACDPGPFVAVEDLGGAELKLVIAQTSEARDIALLLADQPYRFTAEPLGAALSRGDTLQVAVLAFSLEELTRSFPGLAGLDVATAARTLTPRFGAPGPGRYAPPEPVRALTAEITKKTSEDVRYEPGVWAELARRPELAFGFELAADRACPPVGVSFRVFRRGAPETVCLFSRNQSCEWVRPEGSVCRDLPAIFDRAVAPRSIHQTPEGGLILDGDQRCSVLTQLGSAETRAWQCGPAQIAIQDPPPLPSGEAWSLGRPIEVSNGELTGALWTTVATRALFFALADTREIRLRRLSLAGDRVSYQLLVHPVLDEGRSGRSASSNDGLSLSLESGTFEAQVGAGGDQCFQLLIGGRREAAAQIARRVSDSALDLVEPGLGRRLDPTLSWQIVGDPGGGATMGTGSNDVRIPLRLGERLRLTSRSSGGSATLLLHGQESTLRLSHVQRFPSELHAFGCALDVPHPPGLVGELILLRDGIAALTTSGLTLLDERGRVRRTIEAPGASFEATDRATATPTATGEVIVVRTAGDQIHVFDPAAATHRSFAAGDPVVAIASGPRALLRSPSRPHDIQLLDLSGSTARELGRFTIPSFEEATSAPPSLVNDALLEAENRLLIGFSSDAWAGVLDTKTGASAAVRIGPSARTEALFLDDGGQVVALVGRETLAGRFDLVPIPLPR